MGYPTVTYSFSNSTTADGTQVNQNFTDVLNGLSDGTKDLNINKLRAATLGSSLAIDTTFSYDIGSNTSSLRSIYFSSSDSTTKAVRLVAGVVGSSYTLTLPTSAGSAGQVLSTTGSGTLVFSNASLGGVPSNLGLTASVGSNALTMSVKGADGNDPSSTNTVSATFRNATSATGTPVTRSITSALSTTISSGSTGGLISGSISQYLYWYFIDNAGTVELAWSFSWYDSGAIVTTTAEGGAGAADGYGMYSTTARSNVACLLIGRTKHSLATAGTWNEVPDEISLWPFDKIGPSSIVRVRTGNGHGSTNNKIRRFSNVLTNSGNDITYADSSTNGASFTINTSGMYSISYSDYYSASGIVVGISLNSSQLTTSITLINGADCLARCNTTAAISGYVAVTMYLCANDVVRAHTDGVTTDTGNSTVFSIAKAD